MKIKYLLGIAIFVAILFVIAMFLPEFKIGFNHTFGETYHSTTSFLGKHLGFDSGGIPDLCEKNSKSKEDLDWSFVCGGSLGALYIFLYSLFISLLVWGFYQLILLWRKFTYGTEYKKLRNSEVEGIDTSLISLSRFRIINILFGNLYKCLLFSIFMVVIYNIPILNRLLYLYTLEFFKLNFFADGVIVFILIIISPPLIDSFFLQRTKTKFERELEKMRKVKALGDGAE